MSLPLKNNQTDNAWMLMILMALFSFSASPTYQVYMADVDNRAKEFKLEIPRSKNPRGFAMFEGYVRNGIKLDDNGNPRIGLVIGDITRAKPTDTHHFNFKFITQSTRWNDFATESCDANLNNVEANLEEWLVRKQFCPWTTSSLIIRIFKNHELLWERELNQPDMYSF